MRWFDVHTHIGTDRGGVSATRDGLVELIDDGTIDRALVFCFDEEDGIPTGNARVREAVADHDRLQGLFRVDPAIHAPDALAAADWAAGFKLHPRSQDFGMQAVHGHLEVAADLDRPVLVHTGVGDSVKRRAHPEEVLEAAQLHPDTTVILAHSTKGYYFHAPEFREELAATDNALIDISLHCTPLGVETMVDHLGAERVLFASDWPYGHPIPMQKCVELADIPDGTKQQVAWRNADRLFR